MIARRLFLGGLLTGAAAPAIVRASSLMQIKPLRLIEMEKGIWNGVKIISTPNPRVYPSAGAYVEAYRKAILYSTVIFETPVNFKDGDTLEITYGARLYP